MILNESILLVYIFNSRLIPNLRNETPRSSVGHYFTFIFEKCTRYVILMLIFELIYENVIKYSQYTIQYISISHLNAININKFNNGILNKGCFEFGKDSPGNDVAFRWNPSSADECQKLCQQESRCNFFLFKRRMWWVFNGCWLKSKKASNLRSKSGFVLGPKSCGKY